MNHPAANPELAAFRTAIGRLYTMAARALKEGGYHRGAIYLATTGRSVARDPTLRSLMRQRTIVDAAYNAAHDAGHTGKALAAEALDVKQLIEGEWGVRIPILP